MSYHLPSRYTHCVSDWLVWYKAGCSLGIKGEARLRQFPPYAAQRWERVGKNKGEFSGQRRTNTVVADNETSAHDQGHG